MTRSERIVATIRKLKGDACLITTDENKRYAAGGFMASRSRILITAEGEGYYLTDSRYREAAERVLPGRGFTVVDDTLDPERVLTELLRKKNIRRLLIEDGAMPKREYEDYLYLAEQQNIELLSCGRELDQLKAVLSPEDRDELRYLQQKTEKALTETLSAFQIGMSERDLAAELIYRLYKNGAEELSFKPEIIAGPNAAMPHGEPSDRPIQAGDALIMDFGMIRNGFWSDMSRTFAIGDRDPLLERVYRTVLEAQELAICHLRPGISGRELDQIARSYIEASGLDGCYEHALSHGIGLLGTAPLIGASRRSGTVFVCGNTISVEPGIYQEGKLGCRIEDLVWIGEEGPVNLNAFPKGELMVLGG